MTIDQLDKLKRSVITIYSISIVLLGIIILATYPGSESSTQYNHWNNKTRPIVESTAMTLWFTLNLVSTGIAFFAIHKLAASVRELKKNNPNLKFNLGTMTVHASMLSIQLISMLLFGIIQVGFLSHDKLLLLVNVILTAIDAVVQLLIAYICWTQGASKLLRNFECILG